MQFINILKLKKLLNNNNHSKSFIFLTNRFKLVNNWIFIDSMKWLNFMFFFLPNLNLLLLIYYIKLLLKIQYYVNNVYKKYSI